MKKLVPLVILATLVSWLVWSQVASPQPVPLPTAPLVAILQGDASANQNGNYMPVAGYNTVGVTVSLTTGTPSFTVNFEGAAYEGRDTNQAPNNVFTPVQCFPANGSALVTTATASGHWRCNVTGMSVFRARVSGYTGPGQVRAVGVAIVGGLVDNFPDSPFFQNLNLKSPLTVPNGGTGAASYPANQVLFGNGTGALQVDVAGVFQYDPSTQILRANSFRGINTFTLGQIGNPGVGFYNSAEGGTYSLMGFLSNYVNALWDISPSPGTAQQVGNGTQIVSTNTGGATAGRIALFAGAQTGGGTGAGTGNPLWSTNFICQKNAADTNTQCFGSEYTITNNKVDDVLDPATGLQTIGVSLNCAGTFKCGPTALNIAGSGVWRRGILINQGAVSDFVFDYKGDGTHGAVQILPGASMVIGNSSTVAPALTVGNGLTLLAGTITAPGGVTYTGGSFGAGRIIVDAGQGLELGASTGSATDFALFNPAGSSLIMSVPTGTSGVKIGNGGLQLGAPTGGDKSAGTVNIASADGYFVNNVALKNIAETLSNKTIAAPVLSGTTTGTYTLGGTPTLTAPAITGGVQVDAPTGGNKGNGTINLSATTPIFVNGNAIHSTGTPTCGTGCATIVANSMDSWGAMTVTAQTSATVNWSHTLNRAPFCVVSDNSTTLNPDVTSTSTTTMVVGISGSLTGTIYWNCGGAG